MPLDLPVSYFSLRLMIEPAPKASMANKPKTELGSGVFTGGGTGALKPLTRTTLLPPLN